jgi:hypothetical protein
MKKLLVWILLVSFINLTGCYYTEQLVPSSYKFDEEENLTVVTRDTNYSLKSNYYLLVNDTLFCTVSTLNPERTVELLKDVKIPVEEMQTVEVERADVLNTALIYAGIAVVVILVIGIIELHNTDWTAGLHW